MIRPIRFENGVLHLLDQRRLPGEEVWLELRSVQETATAIRNMVVRGAPAIGVTAAYGMVLAAGAAESVSLDTLERAGETLCEARPTAVNLAWAVKRMLESARDAIERGAGRDELFDRLARDASELEQKDVSSNERLGRHGASLIPDPARILTHCNTGSLATAGYGTALGVVRAATAQGKTLTVVADETRPFLQGARLTAWELDREGIPYEIITDSMAGALMARNEVDVVIVGADRIAANGDVANKVGTYPLAVLARRHGVPFYVAAPISTVDPDTPSGEKIPIEERDAAEVLAFAGINVAPEGARARHIAFDVTPASLVSAIVTDEGIARAPYERSLARLLGVELEVAEDAGSGPPEEAAVPSSDSRGETLPDSQAEARPDEAPPTASDDLF